MSDFGKFKKLSSKEKFYSSLTDRKISGKEYEHVPNVWEKIEMKTMKDYHDLYLKCNFLLLVNVFKKIRNNSLKSYGLCPSHFLRVPGFSWDSMLKMTKIELELISDPDMYLFFEKGTRCVISYISNRCSKANNKYLKSYNPKEESKHSIYLDANNPYGYAMSKFFQQVELVEIDKS